MIVSASELDRQRLIQWGIPSHKVVTIPNGIDLSDFEEPADARALRRELGLDKDRPLVMQVGRLSAQKNPHSGLRENDRAAEGACEGGEVGQPGTERVGGLQEDGRPVATGPVCV